MLDLTRLPGWPERLLEVVDDHRRAPFVWGRYDCATLFAAAVHAVTGEDPLHPFRPWSSERSAAARLVRAGFDDMLEFARAHFPEVPPAKARRGDVGFCKVRARLSCPAVVLGADSASRDEKGWVVFSTTMLTSAFRVG